MRSVRLFVLACSLVCVGAAGYFLKGIHTHCKVAEDKALACSISRLQQVKNLVDIAVLGSGPAGLTAALYGARYGYKTLVIQGGEPGGQLTKTTWVENLPGFKKILGQQAIKDMEEQAREAGADFLQDTATNVDLSDWPYHIKTEEGHTIAAQAIIIATGSTPKKLAISGEQEYWGRGVSSCAICDGPFYKGKDVVVVGAGDSAAEQALQLSVYARKVTILVRKGKEGMRASRIMQERIAALPNVSLMFNIEPKKVMGDGNQVKALETANNKTGEVSVLSTEGIFVAIGHLPNTQLFADSLPLTEHGYIKIFGRSQETALAGVFAAGEVDDDYYRQAVIAAGEGAKATHDARAFLTEIGFNQLIARDLEDKGHYFEFKNHSCYDVPTLTTNADFDQVLSQKGGLAVVDFYADYCPSCMDMLPRFNAVAQRFKDAASFFKIDVTQAPELVARFHVIKVPCLLIFKDGALIARYNTTMTKSALADLVQQLR
jgi:thioredoxin reductase (NADPH)